MNNILQKVLAELKVEKPRLDYVIGMLETLIEMQEPIEHKSAPLPSNPLKLAESVVNKNPQGIDDGTFLNAVAKANVDKLKAESEKMQNAGL